jgi:hypothetical protein
MLGILSAPRGRELNPEEILIDERHASYALELLNHHFGGSAPAIPLKYLSEASKTFQDFHCPAGRVYVVNVSWDKARPDGVEASNDPLNEASYYASLNTNIPEYYRHRTSDRECRRSSWAKSTWLADAIKKAALKSDPRFHEIQVAELPQLTCRVSLLRRFTRPLTHGNLTKCLELSVPNALRSRLDDMVYEAMCVREQPGMGKEVFQEELENIVDRAKLVHMSGDETNAGWTRWYYRADDDKLSYQQWLDAVGRYWESDDKLRAAAAGTCRRLRRLAEQGSQGSP